MAQAEKSNETAHFGRRQLPVSKRPGYPRAGLPETLAGRTRDVIDVSTGILQYNAGQFKEAIGSFKSALEENRKNPVASMYLGIMLRDLGQLDYAILMLTRSIELYEQSAKAHVERARAYVNKKSLEEAKADLNRALELIPGYAPAYLWLGKVRSLEGMHAEAIMLVEKYCELVPEDTEIRDNLQRYKEDDQKRIRREPVAFQSFSIFMPVQSLDSSMVLITEQKLIPVLYK
jgi:tetratricopeptide (TPR) repeat protein